MKGVDSSSSNGLKSIQLVLFVLTKSWKRQSWPEAAIQWKIVLYFQSKVMDWRSVKVLKLWKYMRKCWKEHSSRYLPNNYKNPWNSLIYTFPLSPLTCLWHILLLSIYSNQSKLISLSYSNCPSVVGICNIGLLCISKMLNCFCCDICIGTQLILLSLSTRIFKDLKELNIAGGKYSILFQEAEKTSSLVRF